MLTPAKIDRMVEAWRKVLLADHEDTLALGRYNMTDVEAEAHVSAVVPDMTARELEYWQDDQAINRRGVAIDLQALHSCIAIIEQAHRQYNAELWALTGGLVAKASELATLSAWLRTQGVPVGYGKGSMDDEAITELLKLPAVVGLGRRALEIRQAVGSASVKKVFAMRNMLSAAGRLHDLYVWHGARTGRPTGSGPQPTNLPKAGPPTVKCGACSHSHQVEALACPWCGIPAPPGRKPREWSPEAAEDALTVIATNSLPVVEHYFGDAMAAVSGVLRGLFIAGPGHRFISSDFTAIEGVVIAALAGERWRLEVFAGHGKIYELSAAKILGLRFEDLMAHAGYHDLTLPNWWLAKATGPHHPVRQNPGKIAELGLGFGGWLGAWRAFDGPGTDDEAKGNILAWRTASSAIEWWWGGQTKGKAGGIARNARPPAYDGNVSIENQALVHAGRWDSTPHLFGLEGMAIAAVQNPGTEYPVIRLDGTPSGISYLMRGDVLYCRLLSGRAIPYHRPRLQQSSDAWRGLSLSFETNNTNPKNGPTGWVRMGTFGGRLAENCVQATACDIQKHAINNLERADYPIVLHTYDEVVAEVPPSFGSVVELEAHMTNTPPWAAGWPIKAAGGWVAGRYRKG